MSVAKLEKEKKESSLQVATVQRGHLQLRMLENKETASLCKYTANNKNNKSENLNDARVVDVRK